MKLRYLFLLLAFSTNAVAQTNITMGETNVLGYLDSGNGNLLCAQNATLSQSATIQSLSFYVVNASSHLRLGLYNSDSSGNPTTLVTQTSSFSPHSGWNTVNVSSIHLNPGKYWLVY